MRDYGDDVTGRQQPVDVPVGAFLSPGMTAEARAQPTESAPNVDVPAGR
jgi:hypothetical protein